MNKKITALLLASCTLLSLAACNHSPDVASSKGTFFTEVPLSSETTVAETTAEEPEETTSERITTASDSETDETEPSEEETEKASATASKAAGKTTVSDAYKRSFTIKKKQKFTTKYPKVTIKGVSTSEINKEIADKFAPIAKKDESVVKYSYFIGDNFVSIFVTVNLDAGKDGSDYYVYNVSRITGEKLNKSEMLDILDMKDSAFKSKVTEGITNWWNTNIPSYKEDDSSKELYNKAIAAKSINSAVPFVNSKGKTCFLLRQMKAPTQAGDNDIYAAI